ncbi:helix-turn-helix domain-containing protein [Micromonospora sp. WMMD967]|uniref:ArsR/SmtB family transcription factor n=1 Tax=Micromonospora sp. WMMD967 TaxID=3016101 RepID=UPI002416E05B|nr:helix-turn-helix domain-containing protein [Micromonospora sp. WMMD967]MDG4840267.1 helix-turn-helix domain-containing protein [Micromonospora sp. WMMD967]
MSSTSVTDVEGLRALAHPARLRILDLLRVHDRLTASECAAQLKLSPKSCSYHLHVLAKQGLVEQGPPLAEDTRQRPWQRRFDEVLMPLPGKNGGADSDNARTDAIRAAARHDLGLFLSFLASPQAGSDDWASSTTVHTRTALMTPAELRAWGEAVEDITRRHVEKATRTRRDGRGPVRLAVRGFPQTAPETGTGTAE